MIYGMLYKKELNNTLKNIPNLDMLKNKKILITGSTGLIGSAIVDTLAWENVTMIPIFISMRQVAIKKR